MLRINEEVKKALLENKPVVALESTIISHGMPYPRNVETALLVEKMYHERLRGYKTYYKPRQESPRTRE